MNAKIICTYNNKELFEKIISNNKSFENNEICAYDNTVENLPITKRYNEFLDKVVLSGNEDFWCVFIHQDFGVLEDIDLSLKNLKTDSIYGATGIKFYKRTSLYKLSNPTRPSVKVYGQIMQGNNGFETFVPYGDNITKPQVVDAIDCSCIIIHSTLIKKYNLHFDENLSFHLYAEELSYRAKKDYKIKTKAVQLKCFHLGRGNLNEEFQKSAAYLKNKFKIDKIPSHCPN